MRTTTLSTVICCALFGATPALAQDGKAPATLAESVFEHELEVHRIGDLIGQEVKNASGEQLGTLDDLLIDPTDGTIQLAVISHGGVFGLGDDLYVAPWMKMKTRHTDDDEHFVELNVTEEQLKAAPTFPTAEWPKFAPEWEKTAHKSFECALPASRTDVAARMLVRCHDLKNEVVQGVSDVDLGDVEEIVLDPRQGRIAYYVIGTGGFLGLGEKQVALPWSGTQLRYGEDLDLTLTYPVTEEKLKAAPEYDAENWPLMAAPTYVQELFIFYEVDPYWDTTIEASSKRKKSEDTH